MARMPIRHRQRWYLREWIKYRGLTQDKFRERLGISKGRMSDLVSGKERFNSDHLWEFAEVLDCEPSELITHNPLQPPPADIASIAETVRRIPIDERERALRAAQRMLETFTSPPPPPSSKIEPRKRKRA